LDVVVVHAEAGRLLEEVEADLSLTPAVDHHRQGADVHALGCNPDEVACDPVELRHQHPDSARPFRHVDPEELLDRQRERQFVVERREVVHPGDVR
jgi:hypothetical protein